MDREREDFCPPGEGVGGASKGGGVGCDSARRIIAFMLNMRCDAFVFNVLAVVIVDNLSVAGVGPALGWGDIERIRVIIVHERMRHPGVDVDARDGR